MKSKYLMGISVIALGLAMSPAAFADPYDIEDSLNGNGAGNDTQTDIGGDATNSPQSGDDNFRGDVLSGNEVDVATTNDNDGNGALNDTFDNDGTATNTPQTGDGNVRGNVGSDNEFDITLTSDDDGNGALNDTFQNNGTATNSAQTGAGNVRGNVGSDNMKTDASTSDSALSADGPVAHDGSAAASGEGNAAGEYSAAASGNGAAAGAESGAATDDAAAAGYESAASQDTSAAAGSYSQAANNDGMAAEESNVVAVGSVAQKGGDIDNNSADNGSIAINGSGSSNDRNGGPRPKATNSEPCFDNCNGGHGGGKGGSDGGVNVAGGDIASGKDAKVKKVNVGDGSAYAEKDGTAVAIGDIDVVLDTDAAVSDTDMQAANVLNVASANLLIADDDSDASMSSSATIGGMADGVSLGQFSANSGSQGVTEQSQTVTANIGTGSF